MDVISQEDCEAIDILLRQRRDEEEEARIKQEEKKPVIKEEKQTDGSCDRTTDTTDATDDKDRKSKKKIRRELSAEFVVFVGPEKRKMKLVAVSDTDSGFTQSEDNTNYESEGDKTGAQSNEEPSAKSSGELISD